MRPVVCLLIAAIAVLARDVRADEKEDVGKAAKAWVTALTQGDADGLKTRSIGEQEDLARWQGMAKMMSAFKKLGEAATAKYGDQAAALSAMMRQPNWAQIQADTKIEINGDEATLTGKDGKPMKMKKDGGEWKVVLSSLTAGDNKKLDPKQVAAMTEAASTTADEIKEGKYPTYIEAMQAMARKMMAANGGAKPGPAK
jgi:hypothetical protein